MARANWESLSVTYRRRLERAGITAESYEQGTSLKGARGHAMTPERPERAFRNPDLYPQYLRRRVAKGRDVPAGMISDAKPRMISDAIGWPGRDTFDVWIFTRSQGGSAYGELGTMTLQHRNPDGTYTIGESRRYNQAEFVTLAAEARKRGFAVQVISTPSLGVTA